MWDEVQKRFFEDHNCTIENDIVKIGRKQWAKQIYRGVDISTGIHNWMIPSVKGCCLIFEHQHFEIV